MYPIIRLYDCPYCEPHVGEFALDISAVVAWRSEHPTAELLDLRDEAVRAMMPAGAADG